MQDIETLLNQVCQQLQHVPGIAAVVLGGSRATGTAGPQSDVDIGVYYRKDSLDLTALDIAATALDQEHRGGLVAGPGGWGNWVDGGAWLTMDGLPVDLILRDIDRVRKAVEDCTQGRVTAHYQPGHPHAFLNAMYMGELSVCRLLWDPTGHLAALQARTRPYPPKMKEAILGAYLFEGGFSHMLAQKNIANDDPYYVSAHVVRAVSALNQALFALNEMYCLNEKKAVRRIGTIPQRPAEYPAKVAAIFATLGQDAEAACGLLGALVEEVRAMAASPSPAP